MGHGEGDAAGARLVERVRQQGTEYHTADGRGLPAHERVLVSILQNKNTVGVEEARQWHSRLSHINQAP